MRWLGTTRPTKSNQNLEIWVRTLPLYGMSEGRTQSKAEMRSVATMRSLSSTSKTLRTLPLRNRGRPGSSMSPMGFSITGSFLEPVKDSETNPKKQMSSGRQQPDEVVHPPGVGGVAAVGKKARLAVGADRARIEDMRLPEAQFG